MPSANKTPNYNLTQYGNNGSDKISALKDYNEDMAKIDIALNDNANSIITKANAATTYSKTDVDDKLATKANAATTYSKTDVDDKLATKADSATTYTKSYIDGKFKNIESTCLLMSQVDGASDSEKFQKALSTDNAICLVLENGASYNVSELYLKSNVSIIGNNATINGNLHIEGSLGDTIPFSSIDKNSITSQNIKENDFLYIRKNGFNRECNILTNVANGVGTFFDELLFNEDTTYSINKIDAIKNVYIENITVNGNLYVRYARDIVLSDRVTVSHGSFGISENVSISDFRANLTTETRIDINRACRNFFIDSIKVQGGNTISDNAAFKINESHHIIVNKVFIGSAIAGAGTFHSLMVDGDFTEDGFPENPSVDIHINNIVSTGDNYTYSIFLSSSKNIFINNCSAVNINIKNCENVFINGAVFKNFYIDPISQNTRILNATITGVLRGNLSDTNVSNSLINELVTKGANSSFSNCTIKKLSYVNQALGNATAYNFSNCAIYSTDGTVLVVGFSNTRFANCIVYGSLKVMACSKCAIKANVINYMDTTIGVWYQSSQNTMIEAVLDSAFTQIENDGGGNTDVSVVTY